MDDLELSQQFKRLKLQGDEDEVFDTEESSHYLLPIMSGSKTDDSNLARILQAPSIPGHKALSSADSLPFRALIQDKPQKYNLGARLKRIDKKCSDKKEASLRILKQKVKKSLFANQ